MTLNFDSGEAEELIRVIAKSDKYQSLFNAKELGIKLIKNDIDLSFMQRLFIAYVSMYNGLHMDIYMGEVSDRVLENNIFEDSYLMYKGKEHKKKTSTPVNTKVGEDKEVFGKSQWVFRKRPKEK